MNEQMQWTSDEDYYEKLRGLKERNITRIRRWGRSHNWIVICAILNGIFFGFCVGPSPQALPWPTVIVSTGGALINFGAILYHIRSLSRIRRYIRISLDVNRMLDIMMADMSSDALKKTHDLYWDQIMAAMNEMVPSK
jgi:hypothetical protein